MSTPATLEGIAAACDTIISALSTISSQANAAAASASSADNKLGALTITDRNTVLGYFQSLMGAATAPSGMGSPWNSGAHNLPAIAEVIDGILADTSEVQAELADGGRTDLILDGIVDTLSATPAATEAPTAAEIANALLDEPLGTHTGHIAQIPAVRTRSRYL